MTDGMKMRPWTTEKSKRNIWYQCENLGLKVCPWCYIPIQLEFAGCKHAVTESKPQKMIYSSVPNRSAGPNKHESGRLLRSKLKYILRYIYSVLHTLLPSPSAFSKFSLSILNFFKYAQFLMYNLHKLAHLRTPKSFEYS